MKKKEATPIINTACVLLFVAFVFLYLFCFQDDLLIYAQHILSGGTTVYNPLVGAILITFILGLVSMLSARVFTNNLFFIPAIYHLPSMLILASLTDVEIVENMEESVFGNTWIVSIVIFVVLLLANRMMKGFPMNSPLNMTGLLRELTINLAVFLAMVAYVLIMANTSEKDHLELRDEVLLQGRYFDDATQVDIKQEFSSEHMTTLRAYALGRTGGIGEHFFESEVVGKSEALLPTKDNPMLVMPSMPIYSFVGGVPAPGMDAKECLRLLNKRGQLRTKARDYLYLSCLLDKNLDGFAGYLAEDSTTLANLPKHYREALTLYNHLRTAPKIDYSTPELDADYADFEALRKNNKNKVLCENTVRDAYGKTYWYYYFFK